MPIFEYRCNGCGEEFEELKFNDEPCKCPSCGKDAKRLISGSAWRNPAYGIN